MIGRIKAALIVDDVMFREGLKATLRAHAELNKTVAGG
jgi:hypothetical protein